MSKKSPRHLRAKYAAQKRHHPEQDHTEIRRELAAANLEQYIAEVVAAAPPLTPEQLSRISGLLRPVGGGDK